MGKSKLKVHLKMAIQRLRMVQQKDEAIAKQQRRAMAQLLEQSKAESARIRVENIIRSDLTTELHEILELYCELLLARIGLIDNPPPASAVSAPSPASNNASSSSSSSIYPTVTPIDPGLTEAILALIHAAPRTTIKELHTVRALLIEKYGRDFGAKCTEDREQKVPERVRRKLSVEPPGNELVESYLKAIAAAYDVPYGNNEELDALRDEVANEDDENDDDTPGSGGQAIKADLGQAAEQPLTTAPVTNTASQRRTSRTEATPPPPSPPRRNPSTDPRISIAPPSPSTESPNPSVKLPGTPEGRVNKPKSGRAGSEISAKPKVNGETGTDKAQTSKGTVEGAAPDVDDLEKRFALLKR